MSNRSAMTVLALYTGSLVLFLWHIRYPGMPNFDEIMYVPSARAMLAGNPPPMRAHPPFAQFLIAFSIGIFGDKPFGWRFLPAVFGSLTVVEMYAWGIAVFRRHSTALWIALIAVLNQMLYVLARVAMLDIFMQAFLVGGIAAFCWAWDAHIDARDARKRLLLSGVLFGLSAACKWLGFVAAGSALILIAALRIAQRMAARKASPEAAAEEMPIDAVNESWYAPGVLRGVGPIAMLIAFVVIPAAVYLATNAPVLLFSGADTGLAGIAVRQHEIWQNHTTITAGPIQMSKWYTWPFNWRPVWFWFERYGTQYARAVHFSGNPVIMWGGLVALGFCIWSWFRTASRQAFLAIAWWGALYFCWAVMPIATRFLYYYAPALLALGLVIAYCAERWPAKVFGLPWQWTFLIAAALMFAYRFPTLSGMLIRIEWFMRIPPIL